MSVPKTRVVRIQRIDRNPLQLPVLPSTPEIIAVGVPSQHRTPRVIHWCLLLFVFSIPFEAAELSFTSSAFSLSKIAGLLFFATYLFFYNPLLARISAQRHSWPSPSPAFWWFLAYVVIYILSGVFLPEKFASQFFLRLLTILQLIIFFWVATDLFKEEKTARQVLLTYIVASSVLAVGMLLHLPGFTPDSVQAGGGVERSSVLGYNPNVLATLWALAMVVLVGLCLHPAYTLFTKLLWACLALPLLTGIVETASRAGIGALLIGFFVYLVPHWRARRKFFTIILALLGIAATAYVVMHSSAAAQRWHKTFHEGKFDGREKIMPASLAMFIERPLLGWQPVSFQYELGRRVLDTGSGDKDAHNLFFHLLLEVGIVGTVPFLIGLWKCTQAAWQARTGDLGLLPIALLLATLAAAMTHTDLLRKPFWLVLALACAATSLAAGHTTQSRILLLRCSARGEA